MSVVQRAYGGELVYVSRCAASLALRDRALEVLLEVVDGDDPRVLHQTLAQDDLMALLRAAQAAVRASERLLVLAARLVAAVGVPLEGLAIDAVRLRAVTTDGHARAEARAAYTAHRDTWYAGSQSQINWWLPLFDVSARDSFRVFPAYFATPIANNSKDFDFDGWLARVGWQTGGKAALRDYPAPASEPDPAGSVDIALESGALLVFSGHHLHRTLPNLTDRIRYSLDFRTVVLNDHESGIGAPRVDNASRGSALVEYRAADTLVGAP